MLKDLEKVLAVAGSRSDRAVNAKREEPVPATESGLTSPRNPDLHMGSIWL